MSIVGEANSTLALAAGLATQGVVIGASIGLAQRWFMQAEFELTRRWILTSALGWAIAHLAAWLSGLLTASTLGDLASGILSLALIGAAVGLAQWFTLRRLVLRAEWWIPANTVSWLLSSLVTTFGMSLAVSLGISPQDSIVVMLTAALTGAFAGVVTGIVLTWLLRNPMSTD